MKMRLVILAATAVVVLIIARSGQTKSPGWQPGEHPRLLATSAEKSAVQAKLNTSGTVPNAIWSRVLQSNSSAATSGGSYHFADAAFLYWVTGNGLYGQRAHDAVMNYLTANPNPLQAQGADFNTGFWRYRDFVLSYDFAYDRFSVAERSQILQHIARQGAECVSITPYYGPGNINMLWSVCEYFSALMLEGENVSLHITDEPVVRSATPNTADVLAYPLNGSNFRINQAAGQSGTVFTLGTDYLYQYVDGFSNGACYRCLDWSPSGAGTSEPAAGSTYYVSYTFTPDVVQWKASARLFLEHHLSYHWKDGYYNGGHSPYAIAVLDMLPYLIEAHKRDSGIRYGRNQDLKRAVDMFLYERLPSNGGLGRRYNTIGDVTAWHETSVDPFYHPEIAFANFRSWLRPFVAWATTEYADDSEGYDDRYLWIWGQAYRHANGTILPGDPPDWREAFWFNGTVRYPVTTLPEPDWPKHRYFRGKEVVYTRTDGVGGTNQSAAVVSMVAGPHNYQNEHDQGDSGSFTFYSLNEDWAIDPGYADAVTGSGANLFDHNSVGIDYQGFNPVGAHGLPGSSPRFGGFAHFEAVALNDGASAMKANLAGAWTLSNVPYVQNHERYAALINGSQTSYMVVADDIQKDALSHSYEWYLHTAPGNTISFDANKATVTGQRGTGSQHPTMDIYSLSPTGISRSVNVSTAGNIGSHHRLVVQASGVTNPKFLHVLLPKLAGTVPPTVTRHIVVNGTQGIVTWPDGTFDIILWRHGSGTINGTGVSTDAKLSITRVSQGNVTGLMVVDGRSLTYQARPVLETLDGTQPVTVTAFGSTAGVTGQDASRIRIWIPSITTAVLEDGGHAIPVHANSSRAVINSGMPFRRERKGFTQRLETFEDGYADDFFFFNLDRQPVEQNTAAGGYLQLLPTSDDWPSISKRDSTNWRRSWIYPNVIPAFEHDDATVSFRYRFQEGGATTKKFRVYLRTRDRNAADYATTQDFLRLEFNASESGTARNEITLGQRVNGTAGLIHNETLTAGLPPASQAINDGNWHAVSIRLQGNQARVAIDGMQVFDTSLPTEIPPAPARGYVQWRAIGDSPVHLDDIRIESIDTVAPVAPSGGSVVMHGASGTARLIFNEGWSTDVSRINVYASDQPITSDANPQTLRLAGLAIGLTATVPLTSASRDEFFAVQFSDISGNSSPLVQLDVDATAPAAINNLRAE